MKRDPELYRQILSEVESWSTTVEPKEVRIEVRIPVKLNAESGDREHGIRRT